MDNASLSELANVLGLTKAAASKATVLFSDKFAMPFAGRRSQESRQAMREARLAQGGVCRRLPNKPKAAEQKSKAKAEPKGPGG